MGFRRFSLWVFFLFRHGLKTKKSSKVMRYIPLTYIYMTNGDFCFGSKTDKMENEKRKKKMVVGTTKCYNEFRKVPEEVRASVSGKI